MLRLSLVLLGTLTMLTEPALADGTFLERFALSSKREEILKELIPGTREYYYFHCLHFQNTKQLDRVDDMLTKWIERHKNGPLLNEIQYRQAVLTYDKTPEKTLDFIRKRRDLKFNHQRDTPDSRPELPTAFDQDLITREALTQRALKSAKDLREFEDSALRWLVRSGDVDANRQRDLLHRLQLPDYEKLPELVVADLNAPKSSGFGSHPIHSRLLLDQLKKCAKLMPELLNNSNFVLQWAARLRPNNDVDMRLDRDERDAYLDRLWGFVRSLPPNQNSLKAHVLYQRLVFDQQQGQYNKSTFMEYLKLPRRTGYMDSEYMKRANNRRYPCDLNADYKRITTMPPVGNDEPIVREYLMNLLVRADSVREFEPYVDDTWLKYVFAETKIVNGIGDAEKWYSMLPPETYRKLRDRIDIDFAKTNQDYYEPDDAVSLDVFVKNVSTMIVKVFEINAANFYRDTGREVNTDINLDGLVASREETIKYTEPPLRRMKRTFEFPELNKRGTYVIDFIGNGKSSRALIRKGRLHFVTETTVAGQRFTVLNEKNEQLKTASLLIGGQDYEADEDGRITVPFSTQPGRKPVIIRHGDFVSLGQFHHATEAPAFVARMFVDREELIRRNTATLIVRPRLTVNNVPASIAAIKDAKLIIHSTDLDGISATSTVEDFALFEDRETTHEFSVPNRLASIQFTVTGKVRNQSQGKDIDVSATHVFSVNGTEKTNAIVDAHLGRVDGKFVIDVLGRTGEAREGIAVTVSVKHSDFKRVVTRSLKSDKSGRIMLGELDGIETVTARIQSGITRTWNTATQGHIGIQTVHAKLGEPVRIRTLLSEITNTNLSVFELRGNDFMESRFTSAKLNDGFIVLDDLPAGDYRVSIAEGVDERNVVVRIADGSENRNYVLGQSRKLKTELLDEVQIANTTLNGDKLEVRLAQASKFARVHVFANTFRPEHSHLQLAMGRSSLSTTGQARSKSYYVEGRNIGDEYRYILDRRYADKYPGNMNAHPGLLLNPWPVRTTQTDVQDARKGDSFAPKPAAAAPMESADQMRRLREQQASGSQSPSLDFIGDSAVVLTNLVPDADGKLTIELEALEGHQEVHVVVVDPINTVWKSVSLPKKETRSIDLRLAGGFDPTKDFSQQKQISVIKAGEEFTLEDLGTSQMVMYDSLRSVFQLFETLNGNGNLKTFRFVLDWPELKLEKKRSLYSKYACHELNYFLFRKDPEFFAAVVKPYLANKFDKTFLDEWLLGMPVERHVQPYLYDRLNTFERLLLAQRVANDSGRRYVADLYNLLPPNTQEEERLFATALSVSALSRLGEDDDGESDSFFFAAPGGGGGGGGGRSVVSRGGIQAESSVRYNRSLSNEALKAVDKKSQSRGRQSLRRKSKMSAGKAPSKESLMRSGGRAAGGDDEAEALYERFGDAGRQPQLFRQVDKTREWAENNYYRLPLAQQNEQLVQVDGFWNDFGAHKGDGPFVSANVAEAANSFTEMMLALAVLDLPFESAEHKVEKEDSKLTMKVASAGIIVHEQIRPAKGAENKPPVLVGQNFFRADDRHRIENNQKVDKFVTDEFLIQTVYGAQVVVTNPTSTPRVFNALTQIPMGALPVGGAKYTSSKALMLGPYATQTIEYLFYFPVAGDYAHYPVHVARDGELVAEADAFKFHVVAEPSSIDQESWEYVSQYASADDVLKYLQENNLNRIDVGRIAWRMQDAAFFGKVTELLDQRHHFHDTLWSYAVKHNDQNRLTQFLRNDEQFVANCGVVLDSKLLTIDPIERRSYQHLEYKPLVNARAHQLGAERKILNNRFAEQYTELTNILSQRAKLTDRDLMSVTYYMLLQDRVGEALGYFSQVDPANLPSKLQHDYFAAYTDFYTKGLETAKGMVERYAEYPIDHWRNVFASMGQQIKEIDSGSKPKDQESADPDNRDQQIAQLAANDCSLDVAVEATEVQVDYENLDTVRVNYYLMDIELLFSRNPFVQGPSGHFSHVKPNASQTLELPEDEKQFQFTLPKDLQNKNVLVEVVGRGRTQTAAYYSNSLALQTMDNYGQLRVTSSKQNAALPGTYVKTYAKLKNGQVKFYKDGYTDLRGRFDYASLSTNELDAVERFSLLIMSDEHGAIVKEVKPPVR